MTGNTLFKKKKRRRKKERKKDHGQHLLDKEESKGVPPITNEG